MFLQSYRGSSYRLKVSSGGVSDKKIKNSSKADGDELQSPFEHDEPTPRKRYVYTPGIQYDV